MSPQERFARWLEWLGTSQAAIASRLSCSQVMVSNVARGARRPGLRLAFAIAGAMREPRADGAVFEEPIEPEQWVSEPEPARAP